MAAVQAIVYMMKQIYRSHDGLKLVADVAGPLDGPPVILSHGGGQTRHSWAGAMNTLAAQGHYVVSYDARGHGESEWIREGEYSLSAYARDLQAIASSLTTPPALVGASLGGVASLFATGSGIVSDVAALILVDIVLHPTASGVEKIRHFMAANPDGFASIEEAVASVAAYNPIRRATTNPDGLRKNLRIREDGRLHWHWDPRAFIGSSPSAPSALIKELSAETNKELPKICENISAPTLLVRGLLSDIVDDGGIAQMKQLIPHAKVLEVAGAGHMVVGDRNDAFITGISAFLGRPVDPAIL